MSLEKAHNRSVEQALNDKKVRGVVLQITMLLIVLFGFYWLINNTLTNLDAQGKSLGFNFLSSTAGFQTFLFSPALLAKQRNTKKIAAAKAGYF